MNFRDLLVQNFVETPIDVGRIGSSDVTGFIEFLYMISCFITSVFLTDSLATDLADTARYSVQSILELLKISQHAQSVSGN